MPLIKVNGLKLNYQRIGNGEPMLILGGTGWDLRQRPNPMGSELADQFELVCFDQRGMGQSDKPEGPYSIFDYASDAVALIETLGWKKAHIVGYSFGGMVAQELAIGWPERVNRLVLAATTSGGDGGSSYPIDKLVGLDPYDRAKQGLEIADLRFTKQWQAEHPAEASERLENRIKKQAEYISEPGMRDGMMAQLGARSRHNAYDRLGEITAPTLVLAGQFDGQAPMASQKALKNQIPMAEIKILNGSHGFIYEGDAVFAEIAKFCSLHGEF